MAEIKKSILIVEDDVELRNMYKLKLEEEGFEVNTASDGEDGLNQAKAVKPNLVLLDIMMPKMNGFDVLEKIKSDKEYTALKDIPVIVLSALGQSDDITLARDLGASDYIIKSQISLNKIVEKVNTFLG